MEILKHGVLPGEKEYIGDRYNCKCQVKFKQKEGRVTHDQRDGSFVSILCPTIGCGQTITVTL